MKTQQNKFLVYIFLSILSQSICCSTNVNAQTLPPKEFKQALEKKHGILIDVRAPDEFAAEHIVGSININVHTPDFRARIDSLDRRKTYFVYCRSGIRSAEAMRKMNAAGFKNIYNLLGGMNAWKEAGLEVITDGRLNVLRTK